MLTIAARPSGENAKRIVAEDGGLDLMAVGPQRCETLTAFGVTIDPNMVVVPSRVLNCPRLKYGGSNTVLAPKGGAWNLSGKTFLKPARTNHVLSPGDTGFFGWETTMLVGINVTRPSGSMKATLSVAGVVANVDAHLSQFSGSIRCQQSRKETVSDLDTMIKV